MKQDKWFGRNTEKEKIMLLPKFGIILDHLLRFDCIFRKPKSLKWPEQIEGVGKVAESSFSLS